MLNNDFLRYDYRVSHNYYFNEKSADFLFKKLKLKTFIKQVFKNMILIIYWNMLKLEKKSKTIKKFTTRE